MKISEALTWIFLPLVVGPTVLATLASQFFLVSRHGPVHTIPFWIPATGVAVTLSLLIVWGKRPASPWISRVYGIVVALVVIQAATTVSPIMERLLPTGLAIGLPLVIGRLKDKIWQRRFQRIVDPGVVCISGFYSSSAVWRGLLPVLRRSGPTKALALPGFRGGQRPHHPMSLQDQLAWLDEQIGDGPAVLVGHSYGGHLALRYAVTKPEKVTALIMVAPALVRLEASTGTPARSSAPWIERRVFAVSTCTIPSVPLCLIYGGRDTLVPLSQVPELAQRLRAELHVIPGMAHVFTPHIAEIGKIVETFLARHSPSPRPSSQGTTPAGGE